MTDPQTIIGVDGSPNLAIDVQPDGIDGTFVLDASELDGLDLLGWGAGTDAEWLNIVCDVTAVRVRRGATRLQGPLTRAEAGEATIEVLDRERRFDPLLNADAIHAGTPLRVRAWGSAPLLTALETRRNLIPNPRAVSGQTGAAAWTPEGTAATGAHVTSTAPFAGGPTTAYRVTAPATSPPTTMRAHSARGTVTPGDRVAGAVYARRSAAGNLAVKLYYRTAAGAYVAEQTSATVAVAANTWTRLTYANTVPATAGLASVTVEAAAPAVSSWLEATAAQLELAPTGSAPGAYLDGTTADDADQTAEGALSYEWTGTANASASIQRTQALVDTPWTATLFTAQLDDLPVTYVKSGPPRVTLAAVDVIAELASWQAVGRDEPGVGAGDDLLERVQRVLGEMGRSTSVIAADIDTAFLATLAPTVLADAWGVITDAADAELGRVWVNAANELVVRARESELTGPVRGTLSDWHGEAPFEPHACYAELDAALGTENVTNRAIAARRVPAAPGTTPAESAVVQLDDLDSQASIRRVRATERRDLDLQTDAQLAPWVESLIVTAGRPELRVDRVSPAPWGAGPEAWREVLATDIGDRWALRYHPELGPTVARTVGVLGIELDITPEGWSIVWTTTPAPTPGDANPSGWFVLDVSTLDDGDVLIPRLK